MESIRIQRVTTAAERKQFIKFPWHIYRHDPLWVPQLISDEMKILDPAKGTFYTFGEVALFMAWRTAGWLAWLDLDSEEGQEYWQAMELAGDYSQANHRFIHGRISHALAEKPMFTLENHHNFAWKEQLPDGRELIIHRKGATPAGKGDIGIIPGTMASPAFIVSGKGNEQSLCSAAHGAGRAISRTKARQQFDEKELKKYLRERDVDLTGGGTEEAPQAYKDIRQVMESQKDLVEILAVFYPKIVRME